MIQINCTVSGDQTGPAMCRVTGGADYTGVFESPSRVIFMVADGEHGRACAFATGANSVASLVPPRPGAWEGPLLTYPPLVDVPRRLHIEGQRFVNDQGQEWRWRGHIDFPLFALSLRGQPIDTILRPRYAAGSRVVATLGMWHYGPVPFRPSEFGDRYFRHMRPFAQALAELGFYWQPILLADAQVIMPDVSEQRAFVQLCAEWMAGEPNILPSLCNEADKNGVHPGDFTHPGQGLLWSRGSGLADQAPYQPGWDWKEWHGRRDWPKVLWSMDDMWYVGDGSDGDGHRLDTPKPVVCTEPMGWWDHDVPGRRSSSPALARVIGGTSVYNGCGSNAMTQAGLSCEPWDPTTTACVQAQMAAILSA